jgi:hypothetical protein
MTSSRSLEIGRIRESNPLVKAVPFCLDDLIPSDHTKPADRQNSGPDALAFRLGLARIATMFPARPPTAL